MKKEMHGWRRPTKAAHDLWMVEGAKWVEEHGPH